MSCCLMLIQGGLTVADGAGAFELQVTLPPGYTVVDGLLLSTSGTAMFDVTVDTGADSRTYPAFIGVFPGEPARIPPMSTNTSRLVTITGTTDPAANVACGVYKIASDGMTEGC